MSTEPVLDCLTVFVRGLAVQAAIGVYDHEKGRSQPLIVDAELDLTPHHVDRLMDTYNYEGVAEAVQSLVAEGHVGLVETFAERLARTLMTDERVRRVRVTVSKPEAIGGAQAAGCVVALSR